MNNPLVKIVDLYKWFSLENREIPVLNGVEMEIQKGELLCIVGASGAGKSTLLHILGGLDRPSSGKVLFDGEDISRFSESQMAQFRNKKLGFVFQFHHLLPEFTALENTMMPALIQGNQNKQIEKEAKEILKEVGLEMRRDHRPGELSGGEQQRVAMARALMLNPQLVLADEPTGNLDTHTSEAIFSLLKRLQHEKGITLIMVTHNEFLAKQADRIIKIVDGKIEKG
ncbi:MAG TPA: ABC transporter ATP-binding protein [Nitrospiria bacterium]|jgi:lipoprotein-releasing system ATP-binding protein